MTLLLSIVTSVIAAGVVGLIVWAYRSAQQKLKPRKRIRASLERMKISGVREIFLSRAQYPTATDEAMRDILAYVQTAKLRLRYVGLWLAQASEQYKLDEALEAMIKRGCQLEFCMINPDMEPAKLRAVANALGAAEQEVEHRARASIAKLLALRERLTADERAQLSISVHETPLGMTMIEFDRQTDDHRVWLDIKLPGRGRSESMSLEVGRGEDPLIDRLTAAFSHVSAGATEL